MSEMSMSKLTRQNVKNYIFVFKNTHAHPQYAFDSCAKFQVLETPERSYYTNLPPLLKPNLKIIQVQNAVILSKIILMPVKSHMDIFSMLITSVQSFKLIA